MSAVVVKKTELGRGVKSYDFVIHRNDVRDAEIMEKARHKEQEIRRESDQHGTHPNSDPPSSK